MTVWVVSYSQGEYSDRTDYPVAWYETEAEAEAHRERFFALQMAAQADAPGRFGSVPVTPAIAAFMAVAWPDKAVTETVPRYYLYDHNDPDVTAVPRGTLGLHGLEATK